jgi:hypothetical protein
MGIGYVLGCLTSIILWKLDRQKIYAFIHKNLSSLLKNNVMVQLIYLIISAMVFMIFIRFNKNEFFNALTAFIVIDISNTERKNIKLKERFQFYESISTISRAIVCGFIAPLFYIVLFGNAFAVLYALIYNIYMLYEEFDYLKVIFTLFSIVPAVIAEMFLYVVYICRNKKARIDFKGDYLANVFMRPLLNVDIMGAYIESVNFYYYFSSNNTDYIKSYGEYSKKVDSACVKDYLSIGYGICILIFLVFFILMK